MSYCASAALYLIFAGEAPWSLELPVPALSCPLASAPEPSLPSPSTLASAPPIALVIALAIASAPPSCCCQGCCACGSVFRPSVDQKPLLEAPVSSEASARRGEGWATSSIFAASDTRGAFLSRGDRPRAGGLCEAVRSVRLPESERVRHSLKSLARPYRFRSIEYSL